LLANYNEGIIANNAPTHYDSKNTDKIIDETHSRTQLIFNPKINSSVTYQPLRSLFSYYPENKTFFNYPLSKIGPIVSVSVIFFRVIALFAPVLVVDITVMQLTLGS